MKFRIAKNGMGTFRVQHNCAIPGDLDGGTRWESYDDRLYTDIDRAREHMKECEEDYFTFLARSTWEPVE